MVWHAINDARSACSAHTCGTGVLHVHAFIQQRVQNGLTCGDRDTTTATLQDDLEAPFDCRLACSGEPLEVDLLLRKRRARLNEVIDHSAGPTAVEVRSGRRLRDNATKVHPGTFILKMHRHASARIRKKCELLGVSRASTMPRRKVQLPVSTQALKPPNHRDHGRDANAATEEHRVRRAFAQREVVHWSGNRKTVPDPGRAMHPQRPSSARRFALNGNHVSMSLMGIVHERVAPHPVFRKIKINVCPCFKCRKQWSVYWAEFKRRDVVGFEPNLHKTDIDSLGIRLGHDG